jgi:hypothetical protein
MPGSHQTDRIAQENLMQLCIAQRDFPLRIQRLMKKVAGTRRSYSMYLMKHILDLSAVA